MRVASAIFYQHMLSEPVLRLLIGKRHLGTERPQFGRVSREHSDSIKLIRTLKNEAHIHSATFTNLAKNATIVLMHHARMLSDVGKRKTLDHTTVSGGSSFELSDKTSPLVVESHKTLEISISISDTLNGHIFRDTWNAAQLPGLLLEFLEEYWKTVYIGQTARELYTRIGEHKRRINKPPKNAIECRMLVRDSAMAVHALDTGHTIDLDNVEVLRQGLRFTPQRLIAEAVEITKHHSVNRIEARPQCLRLRPQQRRFLLFLYVLFLLCMQLFLILPSLYAERWTERVTVIVADIWIVICSFFSAVRLVLTNPTIKDLMQYSKSGEDWTYCTYCRKSRPPRTHHCHTYTDDCTCICASAIEMYKITVETINYYGLVSSILERSSLTWNPVESLVYGVTRSSATKSTSRGRVMKTSWCYQLVATPKGRWTKIVFYGFMQAIDPLPKSSSGVSTVVANGTKNI
ncbi:hypothetical protein CLF_105845 [Clonorchis sinensis]|uniref:Uncharacterized protein n=1 Tax=Clonorchis sinensis TaxID=79923 RepID=G7YEA5_CLOSI|nr:hypothetical protein CLF_105845 [Clonorchis sinensis]